MNDIRGFIFLVFVFCGGAAPSHAARIPQIGFLSLISAESDSRVPSFIQGLKDLGYVEGRSIHIEWRSAEGSAARLPGLAKELVQRKVDVIVAIQPQAVNAARTATKEIPIVFAAAQDPVGMGLANTLSRPGGNVTGTSAMTTDVLPKQLQLVQRVLPDLSRVVVLLNPTNPAGSRVVRSAFEQAGAAGKVSIEFLDVQKTEDIDVAYGRAKAARAEAVIAGPDSFFVQSRAAMARAALANGLPTMFLQREHAVAGGMMSYGPDMKANYRRAAYYVDRILKGAKPGDLPIEQPSTLELIVNEKTARALGIAIPTTVLLQADEVIR
jgi:putative tryptophan/tyrosine transport system substrate-binding protein